MNNGTFLHLFEYFLLPLIVVLFSSMAKFLAQKSRRKSIWRFFNMGLDLMIMTSFGLLIHGVSIVSHVTPQQSSNFFVSCTIAFVIYIMVTMFVVVFIRQYGEESKKCTVVSNLCGLASMIFLIVFIEKGASFYEHKEPNEKISHAKIK